LDFGKDVGKKPGFWGLGNGLIDFGRKETGFLFYFWTSANVWVRNPVSGGKQETGFLFYFWTWANIWVGAKHSGR